MTGVCDPKKSGGDGCSGGIGKKYMEAFGTDGGGKEAPRARAGSKID